MSTLLKKAIEAKDLAIALGAQEVKVVTSRSRGVDLEYRDGQLERLQDQTEQSLSISLLVDGKFSAHSTCDLRSEVLKQFIQDGVEMTRYLEVDPYRGLADPKYYQNRAQIDLQTTDSQYVNYTAEKRQDVLKALYEQCKAQSTHLPVVSIASSVGDGYMQSARVHSNGFEGETEGTSFYVSAEVTLKEEDGKRPNGTAFSSQRHLEDLDSIKNVASKAVRKAQTKLKAQKLKTGKYTILVENQAVPRLLAALLSPLSGAALQQKRSVWDGKIDTQITSPLLSLIDQPHIIRGLGSALWDGDGISTYARPLIEEGVLKTYLINHYYSKKMNIPVTGGSTHNLQWQLGKHDLAALAKEIGNGILIDRFLGGNSNSTTGEISFGCGGMVIKNGELTDAVSEVNLSSNITQIWKDLVLVGNDPYRESSSACPSCVFENVQLSGI
jgi:PmbA protein